MERKVVHTDRAPAAIGPYSQGIIQDGILYTAGQIALDPETGEMLKGDLKVEAERVFENLSAVLAAAGTDFSQVIKANVYLVSMADFPTLNEVYATYLGKAKPARSTVAVSELPKGARVEIDLVAKVPAP